MKHPDGPQRVLRRTFLIEGLPGDLKPADPHLQLFDNYIPETSIRLRKIRNPETKNWVRRVEKLRFENSAPFRSLEQSSIELAAKEYDVLASFEGRELRKNRYIYQEPDAETEIDIYLGKLWGLNLANIYFETEKGRSEFVLPEYSIVEVTNDEFFDGPNLVGMSFKDVQERFLELRKEAGENPGLE